MRNKDIVGKFDQLSAENRRMVAKNTNNNNKALERFDAQAAKDRARIASRSSSGYDKIAATAKARQRSAIRTGGQW